MDGCLLAGCIATCHSGRVASTIRIALALVLTCLGALAILGNIALLVSYATARKGGSLIPVFGGVLCATGAMLLVGRFEPLASLALLEPRCVPMLVLLVAHALRGDRAS